MTRWLTTGDGNLFAHDGRSQRARKRSSRPATPECPASDSSSAAGPEVRRHRDNDHQRASNCRDGNGSRQGPGHFSPREQQYGISKGDAAETKTTSKREGCRQRRPPDPRTQAREKACSLAYGAKREVRPWRGGRDLHPYDPEDSRKKKDADVSLSSYAGPQKHPCHCPLPANSPGFGTGVPACRAATDNMQDSADLLPLSNPCQVR